MIGLFFCEQGYLRPWEGSGKPNARTLEYTCKCEGNQGEWVLPNGDAVPAQRTVRGRQILLPRWGAGNSLGGVVHGRHAQSKDSIHARGRAFRSERPRIPDEPDDLPQGVPMHGRRYKDSVWKWRVQQHHRPCALHPVRCRTLSDSRRNRSAAVCAWHVQ